MGLLKDKELRAVAKEERKAARSDVREARKKVQAEARAEKAAARKALREEQRAMRKAMRAEKRAERKAKRKEAREAARAERKVARKAKRQENWARLRDGRKRKESSSDGSFETWSESEKRWYNSLSVEDFVFLHDVAEHGCVDEEDEETLERLRRSWREETGK